MNNVNSRHSFRARWHEYNDGIYFVTICTHEKQHLFGRIIGGEMKLSDTGIIAEECINAIPRHHKDTEIITHVVMPNHVHILLSVSAPVGARYIAPPVRARYIAPVRSAPPLSTPESFGCLKPSKQGEECTDYHHNSRLAMIVGSFKAAVTREHNRRTREYNRPMGESNRPMGESNRPVGARYIAPVQSAPPQKIWQRLYHEHIVRNQRAFDNIMEYIDNNVINWSKDCFRHDK